MARKRNFTLMFAATSFVMASLGTKISLAYWASAVVGNEANNNGTVNTGNWDRYTTDNPISDCNGLRTMLQTNNTSLKYHLTSSLSCPSMVLTNPTTKPVFKGTFYGNGFTLSDISLANGRAGLFCTLSGATIQNLILDSVNVGFNNRAITAAGILAATTSGTKNVTISKVRIYHSSVYVKGQYSSSAGTAGGIVGRSSSPMTISNVMLQNVSVNNSSSNTNSGAGGIIGRMSSKVAMSDIYVEGEMISPSNSGGIVGYLDTNGTLTANRIITYANFSIRATNGNAGGVVGRNTKNGGQSLTDIFFTGKLYGGSKKAGTIYNGTAMTYSNAWTAEWGWDNTNQIIYTAMTGKSASNPLGERSQNTTESWWSSSLPNIATNGRWIYDAASYIFELKPKV